MYKLRRDYDTVEKRLREQWGFSRHMARVWAHSISGGKVKEGSVGFRTLKRGRLAQVMDFYKIIGGTKKRPNFTTDEDGIEAVRLANDQVRSWGWGERKEEDTEAYWAIFYYGIETKKSWESAHSMMKDFALQIKVDPGYRLTAG